MPEGGSLVNYDAQALQGLVHRPGRTARRVAPTLRPPPPAPNEYLTCGTWKRNFPDLPVSASPKGTVVYDAKRNHDLW